MNRIQANIDRLNEFIRGLTQTSQGNFRNILYSLICAVRDDERNICAKELKKAGLGSSARRLTHGARAEGKVQA